MANSTGTKRDPGLVSSEPWEIEYIHRQFPQKSHEEVVRAIEDCKQQLHGSEDRDKIMSCLREKFGSA